MSRHERVGDIDPEDVAVFRTASKGTDGTDILDWTFERLKEVVVDDATNPMLCGLVAVLIGECQRLRARLDAVEEKR